MKAVILAAGQGTRLGATKAPKPLTELADGSTILARLIHQLNPQLPLKDIVIVVGYKKHTVEQAFPGVCCIDSPLFATQNTAKSLLKAMDLWICEDMLWINGDVVFRDGTIEKLLAQKGNRILVNKAEVDAEQIKYTLKPDGSIAEISKSVENPLGEALGVNIVTKDSFQAFKENLRLCSENDYFEKGLEMCIKQGLTFWPVEVEAHACIEIDFPEDLDEANRLIASWTHK